MRADSLGLFWQDVAKIREKKAQPEKRKAPPRFWEAPDYLPGLEIARNFKFDVMTDDELYRSAFNGDRLFWDVECYSNYFLCSFRSVATKKIVYFEKSQHHYFDKNKLGWILQNCCIIGFNSIQYDTVIATLAVNDKTCTEMKHATNMIILEGQRPFEVLRYFRIKAFPINQIDLIEVAPLRGSLKIYAGRGHVDRMQDLPFHHDSVLTYDQMLITRWYNLNDLDSTANLHSHLTEQISLREMMTQRYGVDVRSRSDAQIAETVLTEALTRANGTRPQRPTIAPGTAYRYNVPNYLQFQSPLMQWALEVVRNTWFVIDPDGGMGMPKSLSDLELPIAKATYRMGIGGLHSCESCAAHVEDDDYILRDRDVTSYYPIIILNQGLYPEHLGTNFLREYKAIVDERLAYKKAGNKPAAESLKIVVNGSYGKLGSKYSIFYAPQLLIQVTLTGQLSLLLLIETFEMNGIQVISANTDGVTVKCHRSKEQLYKDIVKWWEKVTNFETEETVYKAIYSRDVNNYIAVKDDGTVKAKGAYANPWADKKNMAMRLHKNPTNTICVEAVTELLTKKVPIEHTIRTCTDIRKFVTVRNVTGGAVKNDQYLGKSIRWYYAVDETEDIMYAKNGNRVPKSLGARPIMQLPDEFPADVNFDWYIAEAESILKEIGYL